jgi:hypothetical protein
MIPYQEVAPRKIKLPPRQEASSYVRPPMTDQTFVPKNY